MSRHVKHVSLGMLFLAFSLVFPPTVSGVRAEASDTTKNLAGMELRGYNLPLEGLIDPMAELLDKSGIDALRERLDQLAKTQGTFEGTMDGQGSGVGTLSGPLSFTVTGTSVTGEFSGKSSTGDSFEGKVAGTVDILSGKLDATYSGKFNRVLGGKRYDTIAMKGPFKGRFEASDYHGYWSGQAKGHWSASGKGAPSKAPAESTAWKIPILPGDESKGPLDRGTPSMESIGGDVEVSDPFKKPSWWQGMKTTIDVMTSGTVPAEAGRVWEKPKKGMDLKVGSIIKTGNSSATITFKDGTKFILKPHSRMDVIRGGFEVDTGAKVYIYKKYGKDIKIESKRGKFSMIGTAFSIESDDDKDVLKVFEGKVAVNPVKDPAKTVVVGAGEEVAIASDKLSQKNSFDAEKEQAAWDQVQNETKESAPGCSLMPEMH